MERNFEYSLPYLALLIFLFFLLMLSLNAKKRDDTIKIDLLAFCVLLFFFGFRGYVNTDWLSYLPFFENLSINWSDSRTDYIWVEPGFLLYTIVVKFFLFDNYFVWIFISSLTDFVLLYIIFKRYSFNICFSFIAFFVWYGIGLETNLMRNIKAILFFLISVKYLMRHEMRKYIFVNLLGVSFHLTSLVFLILFPLLLHKFNKKTLWILFVIGNILTIFNIQYLIPIIQFLLGLMGDNLISLKLSNYISSESIYSARYAISIGHIERCIMYFLVCIFSNDLIKRNAINTIFINSYVLYFCSFTYLGELTIFVSRITILFAYSYWILIPCLYELVEKSRNRMFIIYCFLAFSLMKVTDATNKVTLKYSNILWSVDDRYNRSIEVRNYLDSQAMAN